MFFSACNTYGFKYGNSENIIVFNTKIWTPCCFFFITSKRIELKSWDWSCCKDKFKWTMHLSTICKFFENSVIFAEVFLLLQRNFKQSFKEISSECMIQKAQINNYNIYIILHQIKAKSRPTPPL